MDRTLNDIQISDNFRLREFQCRHCQAVKVDSVLIDNLQRLREELGVPVTVTSGYRCPEYNKLVGGATNSQHVVGTAADIIVAGYTPEQIAEIADRMGFDGIGVYDTFTHVDVRGYHARWTG